MKTALVTGGAGFLGSHLVESLVRQHFHVLVLDNFSTCHPENVTFLKNLGESVQVIRGDVSASWDAWTQRLDPKWTQGLEVVFHLASPASPKFFTSLSLEILQANSLGLANALQFADRFGAKLLFTSTSEIYGDRRQQPLFESDFGVVNTYGPRACYDESKRFGEALIYAHNQRFQKRHGVVRIFNTYGPRMNPQDGRVIVEFLARAQKGRSLRIQGSGEQTRSFCYVDDLIQGLLQAWRCDICEPLNLGNPSEIRILDLAVAVQQLFPGVEIPVEFGPALKDDPLFRRPSIELALRTLRPWQPEVSLPEGLRRTLLWMQNSSPI